MDNDKDSKASGGQEPKDDRLQEQQQQNGDRIEERQNSDENKVGSSSDAIDTTLFTRYANWLESNKYTRKSTQFVYQRPIVSIITVLLVIGLVPFSINLLSSEQEMLIRQEVRELSGKISSLQGTVKQLRDEVASLRSQLTANEDKDDSDEGTLLRLNQMTIEGKQVVVDEGQMFFVNKSDVTLGRLRFVDDESGRSFYATEIELCQYRIGEGDLLNMRGQTGSISLHLPEDTTTKNFTIWLKKVHFKDMTGASYKGAGYFFLQLGER